MRTLRSEPLMVKARSAVAWSTAQYLLSGSVSGMVTVRLVTSCVAVVGSDCVWVCTVLMLDS